MAVYVLAVMRLPEVPGVPHNGTPSAHGRASLLQLIAIARNGLKQLLDGFINILRIFLSLQFLLGRTGVLWVMDAGSFWQRKMLLTALFLTAT